MSERTTKFSEKLNKLVEEGEELLFSLHYEFHREFYETEMSDLSGSALERAEDKLKNRPYFKDEYQKWYSESLAVIKQVLPDRLTDFCSYYEYGRTRKEITFQNYMIKDYLQGLLITRLEEVRVDGSAAIPEFMQQLSIVKAARDTLDSVLLDLSAVLQADLFDSEIDTARALAKSGYFRAAGAICGVVLEKHLDHVRQSRNLNSKKKNLTISDLLQVLRAGNVITLAQERFVQSLADTRNLCAHAKGREPTKEEIGDLIEGSAKVLKTIF